MRLRIPRLASLPALLGIVALAAFGPIQSIRAATFETGGLRITYSGPDVLTFGNIKPGDSNRKEFSIENISSSPQNIAIGATSFVDLLSTALVVRPDINGSPIWTRSLASLSGTQSTGIEILPLLSPGQSVTLGITISLPATAGNEFQNLVSSGFSLVIGSQLELLPTQAPGATNGGVTGPGDGGQPLSPAPILQFDGQPLSLLAPGGAQPTPASSPTALANEPPITQNQPVDTSEVLGASASQDLMDCFWWWLLPLLFAVLLVVYRIIGRANRIPLEAVWPALAAIGTIALHEYLHTWYREVDGCAYTTYIIIGELAVFYIFMWLQDRDQNRSAQA